MNSLIQQMTRCLLREKRTFHTCATLEAARKGTRMRREALKRKNKKVEEKKIFIPYAKKLEMEKIGTISPRIDDSTRLDIVDDVYFSGYHKIKSYTIEEAVMFHRETAHPTIFNKPDGPLLAFVELDMKTDRKNKYLSAFSNIVLLPYSYPITHRRSIMALCKDDSMVAQMNEMKVDLAIGPEFTTLIEKGELDFQAFTFVLAHTSVLPDLVMYRNNLKKKMPAVKAGTAGPDLELLVRRFQDGIKYELVKDKYDLNYGSFTVDLGSLNTDIAHLEANLHKLLKDIEEAKPNTRSEKVITRVFLKCQHSRERFKYDYEHIFTENKVEELLQVSQ